MNRKEAQAWMIESPENVVVSGSVQFRYTWHGVLEARRCDVLTEWGRDTYVMGCNTAHGYEKVLPEPKPFEEIDAFVAKEREGYSEKGIRYDKAYARLVVAEALRQFKEQK